MAEMDAFEFGGIFQGELDETFEFDGSMDIIEKISGSRLQSGSATPQAERQTVRPETGFDGFSEFVVEAIPSDWGHVSYNGFRLRVE